VFQFTGILGPLKAWCSNVRRLYSGSRYHVRVACRYAAAVVNGEQTQKVYGIPGGQNAKKVSGSCYGSEQQ